MPLVLVAILGICACEATLTLSVSVASSEPAGGEGEGEGDGDGLDALVLPDGTALELMASYDARDATATAWPPRYGGTGPILSPTGAGAAAVLDQSMPLPGYEAVLFPGAIETGQYFESSSVDAAQVGTRDFVIETYGCLPSGAPATSNGVFSNASNGSPNGWDLAVRATTNHWYFHLDTVSGVCAGVVAPAAALSCGHVIAFFDRSGNMRGYLDGVFASSISLAACTGSADSPRQKLRINAFATTPTPKAMSGSFKMSLARAWRCKSDAPACIGSTAQQDAVADSRFQRLLAGPSP